MPAFDTQITDTTPVIVQGVKGAKSKPFTKRFRTFAAYIRWTETDAASDFEAHFVTAAGF